MATSSVPRIAVGPDGGPIWLADAVRRGGAEVVDGPGVDAIVWGDALDVDGLRATLAASPTARWVQLPFAGIENFVTHLDGDRTWTCGKGVYAEPVAELALSLALAGMRGLGTYVRADRWGGPQGRNLLGASVTIFGGGGIAESLARLLVPWDCRVTVVRNRVQAMDHVDAVVGADRGVDALADADLVVLALALTDETESLIGREELGVMPDHSWLVNVARGRHVVTDDLVDALREGRIGGAGLDVTEPEPLPAGHPLWSLSNCIITPHVGNTPEMAKPLLAQRVTENVRRFIGGTDLIGRVDVHAGY